MRLTMSCLLYDQTLSVTSQWQLLDQVLQLEGNKIILKQPTDAQVQMRSTAQDVLQFSLYMPATAVKSGRDSGLCGHRCLQKLIARLARLACPAVNGMSTVAWQQWLVLTLDVHIGAMISTFPFETFRRHA